MRWSDSGGLNSRLTDNVIANFEIAQLFVMKRSHSWHHPSPLVFRDNFGITFSSLASGSLLSIILFLLISLILLYLIIISLTLSSSLPFNIWFITSKKNFDTFSFVSVTAAELFRHINFPHDFFGRMLFLYLLQSINFFIFNYDLVFNMFPTCWKL